MKKIINSFKYALQGFVQAFKSEKNMKIHVMIAILVTIAAIILKISLIEWIICIALISVVIAAELFNTAIETTVDLAMPEKNEKAKIAKDVSASAVLILSIGAAIIGLIIFLPKITASL